MSRKPVGKARLTFGLGRGMKLYVPILLFAVVFTQALRSPISIVFLWFTVSIPVLSFFYALIMRANVGAFVMSDETTVEKLTEISYEFRVSNYSFLPLPFAEAEIYLPSDDGVACVCRNVSLSVLPRGEYYFKSDVTFRYRGSYLVGVGSVYVSDMFRLFRLRRKVNIYSKIYVMPRKMIFSRGDDNSPSDTPTDSKLTRDGSVSSEANLIREYRVGDQLKHIHWKLSSKLGDLQVNDYKPNAGKNVYVFCDFATIFPSGGQSSARHTRDKNSARENDEKKRVRISIPARPAESMMTTEEKLDAISEAAADRAAAAAAVAAGRAKLDGADAEEPVPAAADKDAETSASDPLDRANDIKSEALYDLDAYCADGVSELAIGVVMSEIGRGNRVILMWFDERADSGFFAYEVTSYADIDSLFRNFGTAPFCAHEMSVTRLPSLVSDADSPTHIYVTSAASLDNLSDYIDASHVVGAERTEVLLFNPRERFADQSLRMQYLEKCRVRYGENNIAFTPVDESWMSAAE